jgi:hypothetical protein
VGADAHPLTGHRVPDFAVTNASGTQRVAELARDGRPLLFDLTERGALAASVTDIGDQVTVVAGRPVGEVPATAVLVRPDGYVAWASSQARPGPHEIRELRSVLRQWFGI